MASNFFTQLTEGFQKLPFGTKKEPISPPTSGAYRPRRSIAESLSKLALEGINPRMSLSLINRGLLNPTGENNCFLNSAVQVLWHIDVFRRSFREIKGHMCVEKACIFCALQALFNEFRHGGQSAIPPDILRQAMAECYEEQHRFQLGLMDDAAECLEKILEQIHFHLVGTEDMDSCAAKHCLSHQKFAMTMLERTECTCGATSEPLSFVQFIHYISSSAIAKEAQKYAEKYKEAGDHTHQINSESKGQKPAVQNPESDSSGLSSNENQAGMSPRLHSASQVHFGKILNLASSFGESRRCSEYDRCKKTVAVKRILLNCPDVVCLGMIWDSDQPSVNEIMSVVLSIGLTLQLNELFDHIFSDNAQINQYRLTALIAYYGRHYSTFCYHSKMHQWIYFDDARFRTIGSDWSDVCEEIRKAHYQPLLLVYSNPFGEEADLTQAPQVVTKVSLHHDSNKSSKGRQEESAGGGKSSSESAVSTSSGDSKSSESAISHSGLLPSKKEVLSQSLGRKSPDMRTEKTAAPILSRPRPSATPQGSTIDPLTLSLVPFPCSSASGSKVGVKSTSPIVGDNQASATPTSEGTVPISALQLAMMNNSSESESGSHDLMSFSIGPMMMGNVPAKTQGGYQLESHPTQFGASSNTSENGDLIEFSLTPSHLSKLQNAPSNLQAAGSGLTTVSGSGSNLSNLYHKPLFNSPSCPASMASLSAPEKSHSPLFPPQSHSHTPLPLQTHSNTSTAQPLKSQTYAGNLHTLDPKTQLRPNWEHFSEQSSKPIGGAPQKLLPSSLSTPPTAAKTSNHSNRGRRKEDIGKEWTVVTKVDLGSAGTAEMSPALLQLKRVASQPGFEDVGGARLVGVSDSANNEEYEISSVAIAEGDSIIKGSNRRFSPLPPTPDMESAPPNNQGGKRVNPSGKSTLLEDLEYAFPHADKMFSNSPNNAWQPGTHVRSDQKNIDYAELDLSQLNSKGMGGANQKVSVSKTQVGVARVVRRDTRNVDYAEIRTEPRYEFQPPRSEEQISGKNDDYSRLVDVNTRPPEKSRDRPIGNDPLYAVPDKRKGKQKSPDRPIGQDPLYATPDKTKKGLKPPSAAKKVQNQTPSMELKSHDGGNMDDIVAALPSSVRDNLVKAQNLFAQGEASAGSDDTVAMMLYQQCSNLLFQVLQDPLVKATPILHQHIKTRREEGVRRCQSLQRTSAGSFTQESCQQGSCKRCGQKRNLDDCKLCGPCQLRDRMSNQKI